MSKEYFCRQINGLKLCGETDPKNFSIGRFSTCKSCRNNYAKEYHKKVKEDLRLDKETESIDRIDSEKGNLGQNIKNLIIDTIHQYPLFEGVTINERIEKGEKITSEYMINIQDKFSRISTMINNVEKENKLLKNENDHLRKEIILIKKILQEEKIYDFENY
jgi:hypothetical protein